MHTHSYVYIHMYTHIYTYTHAFIYTYIHVYTYMLVITDLLSVSAHSCPWVIIPCLPSTIQLHPPLFLLTRTQLYQGSVSRSIPQLPYCPYRVCVIQVRPTWITCSTRTLAVVEFGLAFL